MQVVIVIIIICAAGALGGVVNALMTDNSFIMPKSDDQGIWKAGIVGNIIVSAVAGLIAWGSTIDVAKIVLCTVSGCENVAQGNLLTIGSLVASILVGVGGARFLTSEIDKRLMQKQQGIIDAQAEKLALKAQGSDFAAKDTV